jgi:hypothetical protein
MSESPILPASADRRGFLTGLIGAGVAVAGTSLITGCAAAASAQGAQASTPSNAWDMSWTSKLGRYRTAYDSPEIMSGAALAFAASAASGYKDAMGVTDAFTPVIILRHSASVMVLNDAMWARMNLGETNKLKDPTTGEANAKRNPFLTYAKGDKNTYTGNEASIETLLSKGAILLTCNRALTGIAFQLKKLEPANFATNQDALAEVRKHVIAGAYVMPNGIFAVSAAQDAGCHYMRVV